MGRQLNQLAAILRTALGTGGLIFLIGPMIAPAQFGSGNISLAGAGLLMGLVLYEGLRPGSDARTRSEQRDFPGVNNFERHQNGDWKISEPEARFRELLERQGSLVIRRNGRGVVKFANRAFCTTFGVTAASILGTKFEPVALDQDDTDWQPAAGPKRAKRFVQQLETTAGPRWFVWEKSAAPSIEGGFDTLLIGHDITEQRVATEMMARAREQAEEVSRAKSRFLAAVGHEVRTPLDVIVGATAQLSVTEQSSDQAACTKAVEQSAKALLTLIDEIVEFSRLETGKIELQTVPFDLETTIQSAVEELAPEAHKRGIELGWTVEGALPSLVSGDEARVRQALARLISSSVRSTDRGGVLVSAKAMPARMEQITISFRIEDTRSDAELAVGTDDPTTSGSGDGLSLGLDLPITRRLARALGGRVVVESAPGRGTVTTLELPLSQVSKLQQNASTETHVSHLKVLVCSSLELEKRALVCGLRAAGAQVMVAEPERVASCLANASSGGDSFGLVITDTSSGVEEAGRLLVSAGELSPEGRVRGCVLVSPDQYGMLADFRSAGFEDHLVRPVRRSAIRDLVERSRDSGQIVPMSARPAPVGDDGRSNIRILVAEDNAVNALLIDSMIRRAGCRSQLVHSGRAAVEVVRSSLDGTEPGIDLVLMDVQMPDMNGLDAAREIRALCNDRKGGLAATRACPPLIAVTANAYADDRKTCLDAGMDDYLAKPFSWTEFEAVLSRWLPQAANNRALATDDAA